MPRRRRKQQRCFLLKGGAFECEKAKFNELCFFAACGGADYIKLTRYKDFISIYHNLIKNIFAVVKYL